MDDPLRDALSAAYDKVEETTDAGIQTGEDAPGRDNGVGGDQPERAEDEGLRGDVGQERARDEAGRFAKAEEAKRETLTLKGKANAAKEQERPQGQKAPAEQTNLDQPGAGKQGAQADVQQQPGTNPAGDQAAQAQLPPPEHWLGGAKRHWTRLPAEVRQHIVEDGKRAQDAQAITQAIGPAAETLKREFGTVDRGLGQILNTWGFAQNDPLAFVRRFMQIKNIDPRTLAGEAPSGRVPVEQTDVDPVLAPVLQRVQQLETALHQVSQQPLIAQQNQIQTEVQAFGNAIAADGSVAHPYFNDVKPVMAALMQAGKAKSLQDAYDMSVYADPNIRASLIAADQAKQAEQRRRAAEAAKGAAATVTGAPGHRGPGTPSTETVGASLERAWDQAVSGRRA